MNWVRAIASVLVLWSSPAWSATLLWNANTEPDLAGYRVYQCSQLPCTRASGNASLLVTLGTVTSFNIGAPAVTQYYVITAYDFANNESIESSPAIFTPIVAPPPVEPPPVTLPPASPPPPVPPAIGASPTSFSFMAQQGSGNPANQTLSLNNVGGGTLSWSASDNATWLRLSPASGTGNGVIAVSAATGSLAVGTYTGTITVSATGAASVSVPVTVTVTAAPVPPAIGASPTSLSFAATQGAANPASQSVNISNAGGGTLSWSASDNAAWLILSQTSGIGNGVVTVSVAAGAMAAGSYNGSIALSAIGASPVTVPVTLVVAPASEPPPASLRPPPTPGSLRITAVQ